MFESTLSIDLGASYTKVSYRPACDPPQPGALRADATVLMVDNSPLIPSIAIQTQRPGMPWVFGAEAAGLTPDGTMKVYRNWKSHLFLPHNNADSANAVIVAEHFFGWLKRKVELSGIDLGKTETRVAMPAFKSMEETARVIGVCMAANGWNSPFILKATEPHANAVGFFSQGRNFLSRTDAGEVLMDHERMFGAGNLLVQGARVFALGTRSSLVRAVIVDIGAFTTDLASLGFDVTAAGDGLRTIVQESHALGVINELDRPLFAALGGHHNFDWESIAFEESELIKRELYQGHSRASNIAPGRIITLGDNSDRGLIENALANFEKAVWEKMSAFIEKEKPRVVYLTGGGALIPWLAERLKARLQENSLGIGNVFGASPAEGTDVWRRWEATGEGLHRIATALGGTSVLLQMNSQTVHSGEGAVTERQSYSMELDPEPCFCSGGNKDCVFCGGLGFRRN